MQCKVEVGFWNSEWILERLFPTWGSWPGRGCRNPGRVDKYINILFHSKLPLLVFTRIRNPHKVDKYIDHHFSLINLLLLLFIRSRNPYRVDQYVNVCVVCVCDCVRARVRALARTSHSIEKTKQIPQLRLPYAYIKLIRKFGTNFDAAILDGDTYP
jgi:hypothetical protein